MKMTENPLKRTPYFTDSDSAAESCELKPTAVDCSGLQTDVELFPCDEFLPV